MAGWKRHVVGLGIQPYFCPRLSVTCVVFCKKLPLSVTRTECQSVAQGASLRATGASEPGYALQERQAVSEGTGSYFEEPCMPGKKCTR